jgi:hypothetical protein
MLCGANDFLTVNHNIILLGYNDTKYSVPFMTLQQSSTVFIVACASIWITYCIHVLVLCACEPLQVVELHCVTFQVTLRTRGNRHSKQQLQRPPVLCQKSHLPLDKPSNNIDTTCNTGHTPNPVSYSGEQSPNSGMAIVPAHYTRT